VDEAQKRIERRGATRYYFGAIAEVIDLDGRGELVSVPATERLRLFREDDNSFPNGNRGTGAAYAFWRGVRGYR
jgi:hypothetical protein